MFDDLQAHVQEIDLNKVNGTSAKLLESPLHCENIVDLIAHRADLAGLPLRGESECTLSNEAAQPLGRISKDLRRVLAGLGGGPAYCTDPQLVEWLAGHDTYWESKYAPGLAQMLCVQSLQVRLELTKILADRGGSSRCTGIIRAAEQAER